MSLRFLLRHLKSCSTERNSPLSQLVKIMRTSREYQKIIHAEYLSKYKRRYYASVVELWARAYTQFVC